MANYLKDCLKQEYHLIHPEKYLGTTKLVCKSSWEYKFFYLCDLNQNIVSWAYEGTTVPYFNPIKGKYTLYKPDIFCNIRQPNGELKAFLIEIKPLKMTLPPTPPKVPSTKSPYTMKKFETAMRRYEINKYNYAVNQSKWEQAKHWCLKHNITFLLVTEKTVPAFLNT